MCHLWHIFNYIQNTFKKDGDDAASTLKVWKRL